MAFLAPRVNEWYCLLDNSFTTPITEEKTNELNNFQVLYVTYPNARSYIKELLNLYCKICSLFMERYCTPTVSQYHCSELTHMSHFELNTLYLWPTLKFDKTEAHLFIFLLSPSRCAILNSSINSFSIWSYLSTRKDENT